MYVRVRIRCGGSGIAAFWQNPQNLDISALLSGPPEDSLAAFLCCRAPLQVPQKHGPSTNGVLYPGSVSGYPAQFMYACIVQSLVAFCN